MYIAVSILLPSPEGFLDESAEEEIPEVWKKKAPTVDGLEGNVEDGERSTEQLQFVADEEAGVESAVAEKTRCESPRTLANSAKKRKRRIVCKWARKSFEMKFNLNHLI